MSKINLRYYKSKNWGDALSPYLVHLISNFNVRRYSGNFWDRVLKFLRIIPQENFLCIGSMMKFADENTIVWGTGFISEESKLDKKPKKVLAVRGPLTRKKLLEQGVECPEVYGDPALFFPKFYQPKIKKKYKLGIIPHYVDKNHIWLRNLEKNKEILILDVEKGITPFVDDLLSCEKIASSSLHGIIAADAYKIPSIWIKFSDKVVGEGFKFKDYFMSVGRRDFSPLVILENTTLKKVYKKFKKYKIKIDLKKLWESRPWK